MEKVLFRAEITDDAADTTYGPAETYSKAFKRVQDALTDDRNISGDVVPIR